MNLKDEEWEPDPTDPVLLRKIRVAAKSCVSHHDLANLRATLLAAPYHGAIPHEVRGTVWLLLLRLRSEDLLAEDPNAFAHTARKSVADHNSREQIEKDVERTRPALARFKQAPVRGALLRLLSLFCARRNVAYVQGFNELLAPFVLLADTGGNPRIVYALFSEFVSRFAPWMLETSESRVFDVLKRMFKYFGRLLLYHDPELYWLLERHMMTPDLYATSWFVTLFARNFTVESVLALWDLLLLEDNPLGTSFFGIALLCSKRQQLLSVDESRIPETLMMLTANSPQEVRRLWKIGSNMRTVHTPPSFQRLMTDRLLSAPAKPTRSALSAARAMQASVCLQTTPDDLVAGDAHYFTWDCRTEAEYNAGHLAQAAHLPLDALREANGKITSATSEAARLELQTAVDMCEPLKNSSHICLVGSGVREEDNLDINMLALYLTRIGIPYVSTLRGGFRGALAVAKTDDALSSVELVDYNAKRHEQARRARVSKQMKREHEAEKRAAPGTSGRMSPGVDVVQADHPSSGPSTEQAETVSGAQGISSFLEKTDAEVSKALSKALNGIGLKYSLSSISGGVSNEKDNNWPPERIPDSASSTPGPYNPFSPNSSVSPTSSIGTSGTDTPSKQFSDGPKRTDRTNVEDTPTHAAAFRRSSSSVANTSDRWTDATERNAKRRSGLASAESSPRVIDTPSNTMSPRPGVPVDSNRTAGESPIRRTAPVSAGLFGSQRTLWGRDATPGWLGEETLSYPLSAMPKGFTVNAMDDRVMAGLRLFPCKARSERTITFRGRSTEFKRRYVGVSEYYFLLLSPHSTRSHLMEVKLIRYLQDISRITFKRSRPELVTFEITSGPEGNETVEAVVCIMPDGLKECVALIKSYITEEEGDVSTLQVPEVENRTASPRQEEDRGGSRKTFRDAKLAVSAIDESAGGANISPSPEYGRPPRREYKRNSSSTEQEQPSVRKPETPHAVSRTYGKFADGSPISAVPPLPEFEDQQEFGEFQAAPERPSSRP